MICRQNLDTNPMGRAFASDIACRDLEWLVADEHEHPDHLAFSLLSSSNFNVFGGNSGDGKCVDGKIHIRFRPVSFRNPLALRSQPHLTTPYKNLKVFCFSLHCFS